MKNKRHVNNNKRHVENYLFIRLNSRLNVLRGEVLDHTPILGNRGIIFAFSVNCITYTYILNKNIDLSKMTMRFVSI